MKSWLIPKCSTLYYFVRVNALISDLSSCKCDHWCLHPAWAVQLNGELRKLKYLSLPLYVGVKGVCC